MKSKYFENSFDLEEYIHFIDKSYKEFEEQKFNEKDPIFEKQDSILKNISKKDYTELTSLYNKICRDDNILSKPFKNFHKKLYDLKIIFDFKGMKWHEGQALLKDPNIDYSNLSLLQISMLLTTIFRSDRFDDLSISQCAENGVMKKLIKKIVFFGIIRK